MRRFETQTQDPEFPGRYTRDEARFAGGRERIFNEEVRADEPTNHFT